MLAAPPGIPYQSRVRFPVVAGEQKLVRVSGWEGEFGPFELHVSCTPRGLLLRSEDRCEDAVPVDVPSTVSGTTTVAGYDPSGDNSVMGYPRVMDFACGRHETEDAFFTDVAGVWYSVVGTGKRMTATVYAPVRHGVIVYCDTCDHLICIDGGRRASSEVSWCSRAGQVYTLWVHAAFASESDDFTLTVEDDGEACYGAVDCVPVEVVDTFVQDNGDGDGWADTHETASVSFTVANRSGTDVTGLAAYFSSGDSTVACTPVDEPAFVYIGDLKAGETRLVPGAFPFRVSDADRASAGAGDTDEFAATFEVRMASDQFQDLSPRRCSLSGVECNDHADCVETDVCVDKTCWITGNPCQGDSDCANGAGDMCIGQCSRSGLSCYDAWGCEYELDFCVDEAQHLRLGLDLNVAGGSGPTEFFEGFESQDLGSFDAMNLDADLYGEEASDGSRCQYSDPRIDGSAARSGVCWPGISAQQADAFFFQVDDGRSYSGLRSLHMGAEHQGELTTPLGQLEAVRTTDPIHLGQGRACSGPGAGACSDDTDCPPGQRCLVVSPQLTFKHQASLPDDRWQNSGGHATASSAVVQVQVVDAAGNELVPWQTIEPKINRYDSTPSRDYLECTFDPIHDGNTEDDLFGYFDADPPVGAVGGRYVSVAGSHLGHGDLTPLGPSSICSPRGVFLPARATRTNRSTPRTSTDPWRDPVWRARWDRGPGSSRFSTSTDSEEEASGCVSSPRVSRSTRSKSFGFRVLQRKADPRTTAGGSTT